MRTRWIMLVLLLSFTLSCALTKPSATPSTVMPQPPTATPPPPQTALPATETPMPEPTATPAPPQPTPTPLTAINDRSFSTGSISLGYSSLLLSGMEARIEEEYIVEQPAPDFCYPRHVVLIPHGYVPANALHDPRIRIYPVERYAALYPGTEEQVNALRTLLQTRPALADLDPARDLPFLPPFNAAQMFATQLRYVDFPSGSGIRYLTQYGQSLYPINNYDLFYTFQGLSADGTTYISAIFPVNHPLLPADGNTPPGGDWNAFFDQFEPYVAEVRTALDAQPPDVFVPNLTLLDAMMASITLQP